MKNQPPLIDPSGSPLPGPQFRSRPGWGGQLHSWGGNNFKRLVFRIVVLVVVAWGVSGLFDSRNSDVANSPTPTPGQENGSYAQTAKAGEGLSHLAARALDAYVANHSDIKLAPIEHAWAVNRLVNTMLSMSSKQYPENPKAGEVVDFPDTAIEYAIAEGKSLTPAQRRNLQNSLK